MNSVWREKNRNGKQDVPPAGGTCEKAGDSGPGQGSVDEQSRAAMLWVRSRQP